MTRGYLIRIRNITLLAIVQVFIFSQIHLFGYATAYIYIIYLLKMPRYTSRNELLLWGFILGIIVDIFGNTPGINAAAATLLAFVRNPLLEGFIQEGIADDITPGAYSMSWGSYLGYSSICIIIFYTALYLLELFTINYPQTLLIGVTSSSLFVLLFVPIIEKFTHK